MNKYYYNELTMFGALASLAFLSMIIYMAALFHVKPARAAEILVFGNVAIENDALQAIPEIDVEADIEANVPAENSLLVPVHISSNEDLDLYTKTLEHEDRDIEKVSIANDEVVVAYRQSAKFLGFIPMSVVAEVKADADGNVTVHYPWYTFLSVKDDAKLRADLEAKMSTLKVDEVNVQTQAQIIATLHSSLQGNK